MNNKCNMCENEVTRIIKKTNKLWNWCSNTCMGKDPDTLAKKAETNQKKFGGHPMHNQEIIAKRDAGCLEKYGSSNVFGNKDIQQKLRKTNLEKYGYENPSLNSDIIEVIREKAVQRYIDDPGVLEKRRQTNLEKYGVVSNKYFHISEISMSKMKDVNYLIYEHHTLKKSLSEIANALGISPTPLSTFMHLHNIVIRRYPTSIAEDKLFNYALTLDINAKQSLRNIISPWEVDIYMPLYNLAIEFNGIHWHNPTMYGGHSEWLSYHQRKIDLCEEQNIRLMHVWDGYGDHHDLINKAIVGNIDNNLELVFKDIYEK